MPAIKSTSPAHYRTLDIIIYPGFKALEAIGPMSVFEYANLHLQAQGKPVGYDVRIAATEIGHVASDTQMSLYASKALSTLALPDDVLIVGSRHIDKALQANPALHEWLMASATGIGRLASLCSGAFFLAQAGLLNGKRATTHWSVAHQLQEQFPAVQVDADAIYIRADRIWTSAGVTAGIDLALAFVEEDHGHELALAVASDLVVYLKRPGGQSQFSAHLLSQKTVQGNIRDVQQWLLDNLHQRLPLGQLAGMAGMSLRNFTRVFLQEVGSSTGDFIAMARLERAKQLLAKPNLSLKTVAAQCGFGGPDQLRRIFRSRLGLTPQQYRTGLATAS